jgi:hypothetical protein
LPMKKIEPSSIGAETRASGSVRVVLATIVALLSEGEDAPGMPRESAVVSRQSKVARR